MDSTVDRLLTLKVKDAMTHRVVCVSQDQMLSEAARLFVKKGISGAPVLDREGRCVGVLGAIDYVRHEDVQRGAWPVGTETDRVQQRMSTPVQYVQAEQTLLRAARLMCERHVHRLPVLDAERRPVGLITSMDVVAALVNVIDERETLSL